MHHACALHGVPKLLACLVNEGVWRVAGNEPLSEGFEFAEGIVSYGWLQDIAEEAENYGLESEELLARVLRAAHRSPFADATFSGHLSSGPAKTPEYSDLP